MSNKKAPYALSNEERETNLSMVAADRKMWDIYCSDPVMQRKIERVGGTVYRQDGFEGKFYRLPADRIVFRLRRELTDEQREKLAARGKAMIEKARARKQAQEP